MKTCCATALALLIFCAGGESALAFFLTRDLSRGDVGADVRELQRFLNEDSYTRIALSGPGSFGDETDYFGPLTQAAVVRYQERYADAILKPLNISFGTGVVGPATKNDMNMRARELTSGPRIGDTSAERPFISYVDPPRGPAGTEIVLHGEGFTKTNNTVFASFAQLDGIPSSDGVSLRFVVEEPFPKDLVVPQFLREQYRSIQYGFYVENANGRSNQTLFTLELL